MKNMLAKTVLIIAALALAGCTTRSLEELRQTEPKGTAFESALSRYYLRFAEEKEKRYDWYAVSHFADKGLLAAYGNEIGPENLDDWNLPEERREELEKAREQLLVVLTPDNREARPDLSAQAQFNFDCWVNYSYGDWQEERIQECRENFLDAVYELAPHAREPYRERFMVYFQWGQYSITPQAQEVIDEVAQTLDGFVVEYALILNGHADASGSDKYNLELSQKRAVAVKERLVAAGVPEERIKTYAFGESDPAEKTQGKSAKNRRVEINLAEAPQ